MRTPQPIDLNDPRNRVAKTERALGCLLGFLPLSAFTYLAAFGIGFSSRGPRPRTPLGEWMGQTHVLSLPFYFTLLCAPLGLVWILGLPRRKAAALRYLVGSGALGVLAVYAASEGDVDSILVPLVALACGLILSGPLYDRS